MANGKRLLFFDILRIVAVALVVISHMLMFLGIDPYPESHLFFNVVYYGEGIIGVMILIFVSGAVLEYMHPRLVSLNDVASFYVKRLVRIYPAYWTSLLIGLAMSPLLIIQFPALNTILEFTGFFAYSGVWVGAINPIGWFIGVIVGLYFAFPFLSAAIRKHPYASLFVIAVAEVFLRIFFNTMHPYPLGPHPDRWVPMCSFLEFGLGIFVVQQGFYPKVECTSKWILFLADFSFYVFLAHNYPNQKSMILISPIFYLVEVALLAGLIMLADKWVQKRINPHLFPHR